MSLPLRIDSEGQLGRGDATEQVIRLIRAMVATTANSWPHAPWFGLHEQFTEANLALQDQQSLVEAVNAALGHLGVTWATVTQMKTARNVGEGERQFAITLLIDDEAVIHAAIVA